MKLLPKDCALQERVIPLIEAAGSIVMLAAFPCDDLQTKLEFILNRTVTLVEAKEEEILDLIARYYL